LQNSKTNIHIPELLSKNQRSIPRLHILSLQFCVYIACLLEENMENLQQIE